jgi:hypothetical protein
MIIDRDMGDEDDTSGRYERGEGRSLCLVDHYQEVRHARLTDYGIYTSGVVTWCGDYAPRRNTTNVRALVTCDSCKTALFLRGSDS